MSSIMIHEAIKTIYPKTEDAIEVQKAFTAQLYTDEGVAFMAVLMKGKEAELLEAAKKINAERKSK